MMLIPSSYQQAASFCSTSLTIAVTVCIIKVLCVDQGGDVVRQTTREHKILLSFRASMFGEKMLYLPLSDLHRISLQ